MALARSDYKYGELAEDDDISDDALMHSFMHMYEWGYLQKNQKWFQHDYARKAIMKRFGINMFSSDGPEKDWKKYETEFKKWKNQGNFIGWMKGNFAVDEDVALELRRKIIPKLRSMGLWMSIYDSLGWRTINEDKAIRLIRSHSTEIDLTYRFQSQKNEKNIYGPYLIRDDSLLSYAIQQGNFEAVSLLLDINKDMISTDSPQFEHMIELSLKHGHAHIYQRLEMTRLGEKMYQKLEQEKDRIDKCNAIVDEFMRSDEKEESPNSRPSFMQKLSGKSGGSNVIKEICRRVIRAIAKRAPISDELLLIAWRYSSNKALCDTRLY